GGTWRAENGTFRLYDFTEKEFIDSLPRAWPPVTEVVEPRGTDVWRDIDGDGVDELIVTNDRRGAPDHLMIISVAASPDVQAQIELTAFRITPVDLDGDGVWEFQTVDDGPFGQTYWKAAPAWYNTPVVVLAQREGKLVFANSAFASYYEGQLEETLAEYPVALDNWRRGRWLARKEITPPDSYVRPPSAFIQILLDHIYFGEGRRARELLDELWPPENPNKEVFLREFDYELRHKTRYFREANEATPPEKRWPVCAFAGPLRDGSSAFPTWRPRGRRCRVRYCASNGC
ncbi:MAG: hypothetical protein ACYTAN_16895, partial [Planctomycetota bacterium]